MVFTIYVPHGTVKAKRVAVATGGYTPNGLHQACLAKSCQFYLILLSPVR